MVKIILRGRALTAKRLLWMTSNHHNFFPILGLDCGHLLPCWCHSLSPVIVTVFGKSHDQNTKTLKTHTAKQSIPCQTLRGQIEPASGRTSVTLGWAKKWKKAGRGWGKKESPAVNPTHFTERRSPTNGDFDWLVACQSRSKSEIWQFMHPTSEKRRTEESFKFSVQETLNDLSQNGKHIRLKPEPEACNFTSWLW